MIATTKNPASSIAIGAGLENRSSPSASAPADLHAQNAEPATRATINPLRAQVVVELYRIPFAHFIRSDSEVYKPSSGTSGWRATLRWNGLARTYARDWRFGAGTFFVGGAFFLEDAARFADASNRCSRSTSAVARVSCARAMA